MTHLIKALKPIGHIIYAIWWVLVLCIILPLYALLVAIIYTFWGVAIVLAYIINVYYRELVRLNIIK